MSPSLLALLALFPCFCHGIDEYEYAKMPKLFTMDDYAECLLEPAGLYCMIDVQLKTSSPSELWYQIKNYSSKIYTNYRHDILHKGICLTKTCNSSIESSLNLKDDQNAIKSILQKCMNEKLMEKYNFEGDVTVNYCEHRDSRPKFTIADWSYVAVIFLIILINAVGTIYHLRSGETDGKNANRILMAFSLKNNWMRLMSKKIDTQDERKASLKGVQGMRFLTMLAVIFAHVVLMIAYGFVGNPLRIEEAYSDPLMQLLYNGTLVVQTFFTIASFLMSYHFLIYIENKKRPSVKLYLLIVAQRWIRLTPIYMLAVGFISTIGEKMGSGPQWRQIVMTESENCQQYWWANLLYVNNYVREAHHCMPQSWYLAADTQLFCYGALVMMLIWKYPRMKKMIFGVLMMVAIFVPAVVIFTNRYLPTVRQGPEDFRVLYEGDPTFFNVYITMEGNMGGYTLGLIAGCLQYYMHENNITLRNRKWLFYGLYTIVPIAILEILSGALFYTDSYVYNPLIAAAYGALYKIFFAALVLTLLLGMIHKCETFMRSIVEWEGFQVLGKLSYCAYLLHSIPQRSFVGLIKQPFDVVEYNIISMFIASVALTYIISCPLCIMVELPFGNLQRIIFGSNSNNDSKPTAIKNIVQNLENHELSLDSGDKTENSKL